MFRKNLDKLKSYKPGKPIEEVKRALKLKEVYKLASNEIPFIPSYIRSAVLKELANIHRYPEANCFYLRQALAKKLKVSDYQIVFGNGSDEIITLTLRAAVNKGDKVVLTIKCNTGSAFDREIPERTDVFGRIVPEVGSPGVISFTTPAAYNNQIMDLQ